MEDDYKAELERQRQEIERKLMALDKPVMPTVMSPPKELNIIDSIPKKTCALEVIKHLTMMRYVLIGGIISAFAMAGLQMFGGQMGMLGGALIVSVAAGFLLVKNNQELNRLRQEYNLWQKKKGM